MTAPRVLVVDDNQMNIELVAYLLGADAWDVDIAMDAFDAQQRVIDARPDLILMDIQLPGMDGLALTRQIKADPATREIPIVAFTAHAMRGDQARMLAAGCDGYISKPIDASTFSATVRAFIGKQPGGTSPA